MYPQIAVNDESLRETELPQTEDERLVAAAKNGDSTAFETLVARHKNLVFTMAHRMTGNFAEAEDLSQQTFMKAFANIARFAGRCSFSTWLVTITKNEARMLYRRSRRTREVTMTELYSGEIAERMPDFMDWRPNPEVTYLQREWNLLLFSALNELNAGSRDTLRICDLEEQSTMAAANRLGMSISAVKSRKMRGRLILRRRLGNRLFPDKSRSNNIQFRVTESANPWESSKIFNVPASSKG